MTAQAHYSMMGGPKGAPLLGMLGAAYRDPIGLLVENSIRYGDIIPFTMMGKRRVQLNHPDLIRHVLMDNHKNYVKGDGYIRFESVLGQGLLTSSGEKWRRDRQRIQPMFKREQIEGYYFAVVSEVGEKYRKRWLALTEKGEAQIDLSQEMAKITLEIIVKIIFGKDNLDDTTVEALLDAYRFFLDYVKSARTLPKVDFRAMLHTPAHRRLQRELARVEAIIARLSEEYHRGQTTDKYNMLALLLEAKASDPEHFTDNDLRDHCVTMVFGGFETTSLLMQWMWYSLDARPDVQSKLHSEIGAGAEPLTYASVARMDYLGAIISETMRLYPPFWSSGRQPLAEDRLGDYTVGPNDILILPQIVMQRHPRWWQEPNAFIPERFLGGNEATIDDGLYFPFSQGARKCIGYKLVEMEAKVIFAKLFPEFKVVIKNSAGNGFETGISLKSKRNFIAGLRRRD